MRLLRNHLRNIDLTEVQPKKLVVTRPAQLDLNSIEKWAPSPIALIRCQSQFLGGLPIDDMEWPVPIKLPPSLRFVMAFRGRASQAGKSESGTFRSMITESAAGNTLQSGFAARSAAATASGVNGEPS